MEYLLNEVIDIFREIIHEIYGIWPYFFIGIAIEALIRTYKLHVKIRKVLNKFGFSSIFLATLFGTLSPLCACGILPLTVSLLIGGLPLAPAMSLLVSSPLMSPSGYTLAVFELGRTWANVKLAGSIFMGVFAGLVTHFFYKYDFQTEKLFRHELPKGDFHDHEYPVESLRCFCNDKLSNKLAKENKNKFIVFSAKFYEGFIKIGKFALLGVIIEVLGVKYIPSDWIAKVFGMGNWILTIPAIVIASIPLHINQISSMAILYGVIEKVGDSFSKGAGLAFLIGGPVTAIPVMAVFLSLFKKKVFFLYVGICVSGSIIISYLYQIGWNLLF